jgi:hypothetical protein
MTLTEQQIGPVLTDYHEGQGGLEAAIWMANALATHGRKKRATILAVITGIGMSIITYVSLRSA